MSKVIKGGTIVAADRTYKADVLVEGERISAIGPDLTGDTVIDAAGCYVMPGGIDPHTHLEMPFMGTRTAETWESGTFAAASGGTTMVVDYIIPGEDGIIAALDEWEARAAPQASCDYGFHMAITGWSEQIFDDMALVVDRGVNSFKHFMAYKGALMVNDDEMFASFSRCAALGALPFVHAENGDLVALLQEKLLAEGNNGPEAHAYSRPAAVEGEATNRAITIADAAGVPVYIVHTSSEDAHEAIRRARQNGQRVWGEPLIQHLLLDEGEYAHAEWDHAAQRVMSPPFRNKKHQDGLWAGLAAGSLQVVATDHCAFTTEQKRMGVGDFTQIPNGTGGLEDRMSLLWTHGVETGRLTMNEFVALTSTNIAKILNIFPKKGAVIVGADADLVIWDPKLGKTITAKTQKSAIDYNVFEGFEVTALPRFTLSRGDVVWEAGANSQPQPGRGQKISRMPFPSTSTALSTWKELIAPRPVARDPKHMPIGV
ncbi:MAG: dihydropyrimidinase [Paracoccaceae bacterium]|nr:dihydropyrimidinase [Paracoccaceae bacterium]